MHKEFREIITKEPVALLRWGIGSVIFGLLLLVVLTIFIKYPDTINSEVLITSMPSAQIIKSRISGQVILLKQDNDLTMEGEVLGYIKSNVDYKDFQRLNKLVHEPNILTSTKKFSALTQGMKLGHIQESLNKLLGLLKQSDVLAKFNPKLSLIPYLEQQQKLNTKLKNTNASISGFHSQEVKLERFKLRIDSMLYQNDVIANVDYLSKKQIFLGQNRMMKEEERELISAELTKISIDQELATIKAEFVYEEQRNKALVENAYSELIAELSSYEVTYLFMSEFYGRVVYLTNLHSFENVNEHQELILINPKLDSIYAFSYVPIQGAGKIKIGQRAIVRMEDYPYEEFGTINGEVAYISPTPHEKKYLVKIKLPYKLLTSYGKDIEFKENMNGNVEIITHNKNLLERMFITFYKIFRRNE